MAGTLGPHCKLLDIATGNGALAVAAAQSGADVVGVDQSPQVIARARKLEKWNLKFRVMDGENLSFPDGSFDAAFSNFGIALFSDWNRGLKEMARVLKPGAVGSIATWAEPGGAAGSLLLTRLCAHVFPQYDTPLKPGGLNGIGDEKLMRRTFQQIGFGQIKIERFSNDFIIDEDMLKDPDELFVYNPIWRELGHASRSLVLERLAHDRLEAGGRLAVTSPALIVVGQKAEDTARARAVRS